MDQISRSNLALAVLWGAALLAGGLAVYYGLTAALDAVSKIFVAVITGIFGLLAAYVTHVLSIQREREAEQLRRKQERYSKILEGLVPYIRDRSKETDSFAIAVLHAYVVGAPPVAKAIYDFMADRSSEKLDAIVSSMRADLDMAALDATATTRGLLPAPEQKSIGTV